MSEQLFIEEFHFNTIEALLDALAPWKNEINLDGYVFRGHAQEDWDLVPLALREPDVFWGQKLITKRKPKKHQQNWTFFQHAAEYQLIREFYRLADRNGLDVPLSNKVRKNLEMDWDSTEGRDLYKPEKWLPEDLYEAAALAQHYGIPTRLLDWSYDIFVAIYFALQVPMDQNLKGNIKVWCLNKEYISSQQIIANHKQLEFITPHYSSNRNINGQQGLFTLWSGQILPHVFSENKALPTGEEVDRTPLDQLIIQNIDEKKHTTNILKALTLPASEAEKGLELLEKMGYGSARIFPGLQGVANQVLGK
ncbi:MAG: FRG domain-containing protein [Colwellia sp.]